MDEKKSTSAWDELVEELGVEADPDAVERHQPQSTDLSSASPDRPVSVPKSQTSDWNALAGSLGLEAQPPAEPAQEPATSSQESKAAQESKTKQDKPPANESIGREPKVASVKSAPDTEGELLDELPELRSEFDKELVEATGDDDPKDDDPKDDDLKHAEDISTGMSGEAARTAFDSLFAEATSEWELPSGADGILDTPLEFGRSSEEPPEEPSVETSESDSETAEEETTERPKRRRPRRRRRGRGGRSAEAEPAEAATEAEDAESSASTADQDATVAEGDEVAKSSEKPRRRRPRRRGRRSSGEGGAEATPESDSTDTQQTDELGLDDEDVEDSEEAGSAEQQSSRQRTSHRNLPTWSEAIGGIVDANLELRSKSPNRSTSSRGRSRGGKGRRKKQG